ncbi:MAG: DUF5908 family protein [Bacteroidota bacterium]
MPVEIKELVIRAEINKNDSDSGKQHDDQSIDMESIVQQAVNQVFKIMNKKNRR